MDCPILKPFGLTYVQYVSGDHLGLVLSVITLFPILIPAQLVALVLIQRDWDTFVFLVGNLVNVALNGVLKRVVRESRPLSSCGAGVSPFEAGSHEEFGMPSNHAQFMGFVAMFSTLYLQVRSKRSMLEKVGTVVGTWCAAVLCSYSRVYLGYHTSLQVVVGTGVGALFGIIWFALYAYYLEHLGEQMFKMISSIYPTLFAQTKCGMHQLSDKVLGLSWNNQKTIHAKVVTHNISHCQAETSFADDIELLRQQNADVICLQEVIGTSLRRTIAHSIAIELRMFCVFVEATHGKCYGNAILSHWPIHSVESINLSSTTKTDHSGSIRTGDAEQSVALAAVICPFRDLPDRDLLVICSHFGKSSEQCLSQEEALDEYLKKQNHSHAIIAGDFDKESGSPFIREMVM